MNPTAQPLEANTQAVQCADLFTSDLREAHKLACQNDAVLEILLRELIGDATRIKNRLVELEAGLMSRRTAR